MTQAAATIPAVSFLFLLLTSGVVFVPGAAGRPVDEPPRVQVSDLSGGGTGIRGTAAPGVFGAATGTDTVYFGGTTWNASASRWEAIRDSIWTFDSGVASHFDHSASGVDPFKDPSLHAVMEGWVGVDRTLPRFQYFRRLSNSDFPGTGQSACKVNGSWFFWCGLLPQEAQDNCYVSGQGYGDKWDVCIERSFTYNGSGSVNLEYVYENDTEYDNAIGVGFDFTYVYVDTTGAGDEVEVAAYTGGVSGTEVLTLIPGIDMRSSAGPFKIKFCVVSDESGSDEDGVYPTNCGAFAVDDISVSGGGISYFTGFETGEDGWALSPLQPGPGGDWSNIVHVADLPPPMTSCVCSFSDSVLVFEDLAGVGAHNIYQNNFVASPWIDLLGAGVVDAPGKFLEMDIYANLPVLNYIYAQFLVRWYPYACSAGPGVSPWVTDGITHTFGGVPTCTAPGSPFRTDLSGIIDLGAEEVQVGVGVFSACLFYPNCTGLTNTSPWFDNIRFAVCGTLGGGATTPVISAREMDLPQDAFPEDGTLTIGSTGRVDSGTLRGAAEPGPGTSLGDTLVVLGGTGGAEVWVQFAVSPGPGVDATALGNYLGGLSFVETRGGLDWYAARMDTAELGGVPSPGVWMTAFHESDPGFSGTDTDLDPGDPDPLGGTTHLANDILPDHLFTPGTRLELFYKTRFTGSSSWFTLPDTTGGIYLEMEVLPSSFSGSNTFNCVLYVDHFDGRGAQEPIEAALASVSPAGSDNFEDTSWDRYDVRASSSHQATFGRPPGTGYGATLDQARGYTTIIWNSGTLGAYSLVDEDAQILSPWLTSSDPGGKSLYLSGDNLASGLTAGSGTDPLAFDLLANVAGTTLICDTFRDLDCPTGSPVDQTACVDLDPVSLAWVADRPLGGTPRGQGNGCPLNRSFDLLDPAGSPTHGLPRGDEEYAGGTKTAAHASVANRYEGTTEFRTVVDGISLHHRREADNCLHGAVTHEAIGERLTEVLSWFGTGGVIPACEAPGTPTGVEDPPGAPSFTTGLAHFSPNPLVGRATGRIIFRLASEGPARVDIYDLNGRLVKRVYEGTAAAGEHTATWDGTDAAGRAVASGVYFYALQAGGEQFARKMVVARN